ncbi:MAG: hypothetical protein LBQ46_10695 [Treponema sp.]|jgi:regulator of RNase E activity RraA|nr:hypothetical protein [Treponema sp.]
MIEYQKQFDEDENLKIIKKFDGLRVTDVRDGMDWMGYIHYGTVDHSIQHLWRDVNTVIGIAKTARYVPFEGPSPTCIGDEYTQWVRMYYKEICYDPWGREIKKGDFVCLDIAGLDVGLLGSNNTLGCTNKGAVGFLTNGGGIRDTDECVIQKIHVWSKFRSQPMDQARIRFVEQDCVIGIGGVAIYPGDVVVADGDGVVVVPRKMVDGVVKYAWQEASGDKKARKQMYEEAGIPLDHTVQI